MYTTVPLIERFAASLESREAGETIADLVGQIKTRAGSQVVLESDAADLLARAGHGDLFAAFKSSVPGLMTDRDIEDIRDAIEEDQRGEPLNKEHLQSQYE